MLRNLNVATINNIGRKFYHKRKFVAGKNCRQKIALRRYCDGNWQYCSFIPYQQRRIFAKRKMGKT